MAKPRKVVERDESFSWARVERRPVVTKRVKEEVLDFPENVYQQKKNSYKGKSPVQEEVSVSSTEKTESAADQNIDKMFEQMSDEMKNGTVNGIDNGSSGSGKSGYKLPVGRVLSHEEEKELIESGALKKPERKAHPRTMPTQEELSLMEKKRVEEERRKKREIEDEKRRQAREELNRIEEQRARELMERKGAMQEARGKIQKHLSQSDSDEYRSDAGYLIERELEEQRLREKEVQNRIEEARKNEVMLPKTKTDHKPQAKQVYIDTGKAGSSKPHPVVVRPRTDSRPHSNRKSWVELEIEEQKRKEEEMRQEIEQRNSELNRLSKDQKPLHAIEKEIEKKEKNIKSSVTNRTVESLPPSSSVVRRGEPNRDFSRPNAQRPANVPSKNIGGPRAQGDDRTDKTPMDLVDGPMTAEDQEVERKIREEEERRRLEQIEQIRKESRMREAEELMRQREIREEELRRKREIALREAEKRKLEEEERKAEANRIAESRRFTFQAQKVRLEERVITAMKEAEMQPEAVNRRKTPGPNKVEEVPSTESEDSEKRERRKSVRDTKALFEQSASSKEEAKVVMRKKRQSLNLEERGGQQKPNASRKDRASFYSDATSTHEYQTQMGKDKEVMIISKGENPPAPTNLNLGNISEKRQQFEGVRQQNSFERRPQTSTKERHASNDVKSPPPLDQVDAGAQPMTNSFFPSISSNKIQQEMEELRLREQEMHHRRQAMFRTPSLDKDTVTNKNRAPPASDVVVRRREPEPSATDVVVRRREPEQKA